MILGGLLTSGRGDITANDIVDALRCVKIEKGDIVMVHSRIFSLGRTIPGVTKEQLADAFIDSLLGAVGHGGIVIFPTFTLSTCKSGLFDINQTKSEMGLLSERARTRVDSRRTHHPLFSVSIFGDREGWFEGVDLNTCFGENSFFDWLHKLNGLKKCKGKVKFLTIGMARPPEAITYIHSIEEKLKVPYRYYKSFQGRIKSDGIDDPYDVQFFVRDLEMGAIFDDASCWDLLKIEKDIETEPLGDAFIAMLPEAAIYRVLISKLAQESDFLCKGRQ